MRKTLFIVLLQILIPALCLGGQKDNGESQTTVLARMFTEPPMEYRPYVWWHWMGSNFSKEGIRKDLEAMRESGIAGATIFNLASAVQESHKPVGNNPWPEQTYRSKAYWEAMRYAAEEAERLGLKIGLHNTPGYSTTGGTWISEQQCMQKVVTSKTTVDGGKRVEIQLPQPPLPVFTDYSGRKRQATYYEDIAVMAVPEKEGISADDVIDVSKEMDKSGLLVWNAPQGRWTVCRIGHSPTMSTPHPLPDDLIGKTLEADKMDASVSAYHWDNVLIPLREHVGQYFGKSFTHILVDSYEAGDQDWTADFREKFIAMHGYDPLPLIAISGINSDSELSKKYAKDRNATINRLFIDNGWKVAHEKINAMGLQMYWEPYWGPFDTVESLSIPDLPMNEFWTGGSGRMSKWFIDSAKERGKNIIGAEAFTGRPEKSFYTEDPAFLKHSADGAFVSGINLLFLHHWVHQPFDDRYQPGMGMGWWGTHFGRNQTWAKEGKAFFTYLSRCQMLLQQGTLEEHDGNQIHRRLDDADIWFVVNQSDSITTERIAASPSAYEPEIWNPYTGTITSATTMPGVDVDATGRISITLEAGQALFVVVNRCKTLYTKQRAYTADGFETRALDNKWDVDFMPKMDDSFQIKDFTLSDFSKSDDNRLRYFSGTATYRQKAFIRSSDLRKDKRIVLQLGEMNDIATLRVNGRYVATLWYPPYDADITPYLHKGGNDIEVAVTNNWANRLIGDEQYEPDFEWGEDRGEALGRAIKAFPDWFVEGKKRPSENRKTFVIWSYFRKDSKLQPAGLVGPVKMRVEHVVRK